ncbi:glycosyltransferase, group 2 family protein [Streptococcus oralis SK255]|uniref:Glycosyltransferase, group 2 family protein n=1 Tax=Streptococcus oralis SK255 TaxID=1005704 RepID=F5VWX7_STROR|nr:MULTISPECIES: glycosyltransferase family 2 protein [Streptococcus]EFM35795.1 glycosyltransferase, group 2 family protein [Streptococcus sp. oral taxon 071 str. 73H25AP]EGL85220.1 glycosyltransferase, group 2 family protein [Streptococcus oralis SK255]ORO44885.1 galactosyl transferase [Streptococcus oralis subsp. tigurinus]
METALISVIVPVYNVAQYLEKSIASIQKQTYQNLEIILVDDGSTDESGRLCDSIAEQDDRMLVLHKNNEGLSQARNDGMKQAHGDYLIFIDSDDYIHPEMIQSLYEQLIQEDADVSSCGVMNVYANDESPQSAKQDDYFVCDSQKFLREYLIGEKIPGTICNKLIKREITTALSFPKGLIYEDAYYHFDLIKLARKYVVNTKPYYYYFHRGDSITTKPYAEKDLAYIDIYQKFYNEVVKNYPDLKEVAFFRLAYAHFFILDKMLLRENYREIKGYPAIYHFLKKHAFSIFKNPIFRMGRRISALALFLNIRLYRILLLKNIEQSRKIN